MSKDKKRLVPVRRFKEFENATAWEQRKLGDYGNVAMNKRIFKNQTSENGEIPFYKIGTFGGTPDAFISRELFEEYKMKYPYPLKGDLLISASGSIGRVVEYNGEDAYFQDSNIVWLNHGNKLNNSFLKQVYLVIKWKGTEGSTIKRLYNKNILATKISVPSIAEQEKIGAFFQQLDNLIALHQRKLDKLKRVKSAYLTEMFPAEGEREPKRRFPGFTGAWEQRKLSELIQKGGSGGTPKSTNKAYYNGNIPFLGISDISKSNGYIDDTEKYISEKGLDNSAAWIVPKGAISLAMYASVGKLAILNTDAATSQAFYNMVFEDVSIRDYVYHRLGKANEFGEWTRLISTGTQSNLNADKVKNFKIQIPQIIDEIKNISTFFNQLDSLIALYQRKLDKLKNVKDAYLNEMFV
ncbi:restriction endonuclease subunit S [Ligilactobacillus agilis]|uniref:restriction endonuclease subunit S n=1 Tax=Ligilactobacillus agilis TaxID=1601 RepID=UPI00195A8AD9|nr:restriction endonuclease subunit S [Ligilactobacillus agilis]MBM6772997.1 restriction endonuclease subunit S [Ligilactobacillus agilis]